MKMIQAIIIHTILLDTYLETMSQHLDEVFTNYIKIFGVILMRSMFKITKFNWKIQIFRRSIFIVTNFIWIIHDLNICIYNGLL
jgi:hypothetical protein